MSDFSFYDSVIFFFVKYSKVFNVVFIGVLVFVFGYSLQYGQEVFKVQYFYIYFCYKGGGRKVIYVFRAEGIVGITIEQSVFILSRENSWDLLVKICWSLGFIKIEGCFQLKNCGFIIILRSCFRGFLLLFLGFFRILSILVLVGFWFSVFITFLYWLYRILLFFVRLNSWNVFLNFEDLDKQQYWVCGVNINFFLEFGLFV